MRKLFIALALAISSIGQPILGQDDLEEALYGPDELADELVHSDLPLYDFEWDEFYPRGIENDPTIIAGCWSRVSFGDWKFTWFPEEGEQTDEADISWLRVQNYGAFHCFANFYRAYERGDLETGEFDRGFFVKIGDSKNLERELWVIQNGTLPGSDYTLLARKPEKELIVSFTVLQRRCPRDKMRGLEGRIDIATISYCAINSREELLKLAQKMEQLPSLGEMVLIEDKEKGPEAEATDPSQ